MPTWIWKTQSKFNHSPKIVKIWSQISNEVQKINKTKIFSNKMPQSISINTVQIRIWSRISDAMYSLNRSSFQKFRYNPFPVQSMFSTMLISAARGTWAWVCCDRKSRAACAQSFAPWQQATIQITRRDHSIIACSCRIHILLFFAHIPLVVNHTINAIPP